MASLQYTPGSIAWAFEYLAWQDTILVRGNIYSDVVHHVFFYCYSRRSLVRPPYNHVWPLYVLCTVLLSQAGWCDQLHRHAIAGHRHSFPRFVPGTLQSFELNAGISSSFTARRWQGPFNCLAKDKGCTTCFALRNCGSPLRAHSQENHPRSKSVHFKHLQSLSAPSASLGRTTATSQVFAGVVLSLGGCDDANRLSSVQSQIYIVCYESRQIL